MAENLQFRTHRERKLRIIVLREAEADLFEDRKVLPFREPIATIGKRATSEWKKEAHAYHARLIAEAVAELTAMREAGIPLAS